MRISDWSSDVCSSDLPIHKPKEPIHMKQTRIKLLLVAALLATAQLATAQTYPDKPVRVIVPFASGTAGDTISRLLADSMSHSLKQPFIVETRPGEIGRASRREKACQCG